MKINDNIIALQTTANLHRTERKASLAMQRMSSGLRINSVADDAAGLAISNKLRTQISGLKIASRNSLDGISLIQTAEGSLGEIQEMMQRMRELAVQSSNDTNEPSDRIKIQMEIDELVKEIDGIVDRTEFNNSKLLNGSLGLLGLSKQNGSSANGVSQVINLSEGLGAGSLNYQIDAIGVPAKAVGLISGSSIFSEGTFEINGQEVSISAGDTADEVLQKIKDAASLSDIEVRTPDYPNLGEIIFTTKESGSHKEIRIEPAGSIALAELGLSAGTYTGTDAKISGVSYTDASGQPVRGFENGASVSVEGNRVTISGNNHKEINIILQAETLLDGTFQIRNGTAVADDGTISGGSITGMSVDILDVGQAKIQIGANKNMSLTINIPNLSSNALGISNLNYKTLEASQESIGKIDTAFEKLSAVRGKLGAHENRLNHTIVSLETTALTTEEARSRIEDADMAVEMTNYTQLNIISQAGISILAQANQRPQQILQLLR